MQYSLELITPPAAEPLTLLDVKNHLRVEEDFEDDDTLITRLMTAARQYTEKISSFIFLPQTWLITFNWRFPCEIEIPLRPLTKINSIKYIDTDGNLQTLDPAEYQVDNLAYKGIIRPAYNKFWPQVRYQLSAVKVEFVAGFGDGTDYDVTTSNETGVTVDSISNKTTSGFTINFVSAADQYAELTYTVTRGDPPFELIPSATISILEGATSQAITISPAFEGFPEFLRNALYLLIGHYYENREDTLVGVVPQTLPRGYDALIGVERVWRL